MNQKIKYAGLIAILPLFMVAIAPDYLESADATKAQGSPGNSSPSSFGAKTAGIVCGDRLCSETASTTAITTEVTYEEMPEFMPTIKTVKVSNFSGESEFTFNAVYEVTAGEKNLENIMIHVQSDADSMDININGLFAHDNAINVVKIKAMDPMTINAKIVGFQLND